MVRTVVVLCDHLCSATALGDRLLGDCWLCATCFWVSCLDPNARCILIVFPEKFCVPCLVHVAPEAHFFPDPPSFPFWAAKSRDVAIELVLNLPKLDLSVTVAMLQLKRAMSRDVARVVLLAESSAWRCARGPATGAGGVPAAGVVFSGLHSAEELRLTLQEGPFLVARGSLSSLNAHCTFYDSLSLSLSVPFTATVYIYHLQLPFTS